MADNIDKGLYQTGAPELEILKSETEVEIDGQRIPTPEGLEIEMNEDGGATLDFDPMSNIPEEVEFYSNLAEVMDERELDRLSDELLSELENDRSSRKDWEDGYIKGLDLLGFKYEERTRPFQGASGVTHPLLAESATQFQATAFKELLPNAVLFAPVVFVFKAKEPTDVLT